MPASDKLFNCLIRTHHITSRKKLQRVRRAAQQLNVDWVLIRYGGSPGVMFAESRNEASLTDWVSAVQALRYKDFRCVAKPAVAPSSGDGICNDSERQNSAIEGFRETDSLAEFAQEMEARNLGQWWKIGMGYAKGDD